MYPFRDGYPVWEDIGKRRNRSEGWDCKEKSIV
jgi:hypothetical protein